MNMKTKMRKILITNSNYQPETQSSCNFSKPHNDDLSMLQSSLQIYIQNANHEKTEIESKSI